MRRIFLCSLRITHLLCAASGEHVEQRRTDGLREREGEQGVGDARPEAARLELLQGRTSCLGFMV